MVATHTLAVKQSAKYVGSYDYLDDWKTVGTFVVHRRGTIDYGYDDELDEDIYATSIYHITVEPNDGVDNDTVRRALQDHYTKWGCACSHDCCGCVSSVAYKWNVIHKYDNDWTVMVQYRSNY